MKARDEDIESELKEAFEASGFKDIGVEVKNVRHFKRETS